MGRTVRASQAVFVVAILSATALAGCADRGSPTTQAPLASQNSQPAVDPEYETGELLGRVLDDEFQFLAGVQVRMLGTSLEMSTSDDGVFFFRNAPIGSQTVSLSKPTYTSKDVEVEIRAQERVRVEAFLLKAPNTGPYVDAGFTFRGQINCSGRVNASDLDANPECGAVEPQFDLQRTTFLEFAPNLRWTLIEVQWVPSIPVVNEELTLAIRPFVGESWRQIEGPSPIKVLLGPDDWTSIKEYSNRDYPKNGGQLQVYMFPGEPANANGLGAGAALAQDFTIYATSWYNMDHDPEFTRLPPG